MGVIARQSIKGALANYLGIAIGFVTTFFVLTDCLSQEEIGLTRVMVDAAILFSGLAQLGVNASIMRYYIYFKDPENRDHGFFGWTVLLPFVGFTLFAVFFFLCKDSIVNAFSEKSPMVVDYVYLLLPLTFFALYLTVFETNSNVLMRITVPKFVREVVIRVINLVCYLLYGHDIISIDWFVILFCGSYGLAMLIDFFYLLSLDKISFKIDFHFINRRRAREILTYTLFISVTVLATNIPLLNSLFLGAKEGLQLAGVYTIAAYIANMVEVPYRSLGAISQPFIAQAMKEGNHKEVNRLGREVSLHQLLVSSLIFFFIWINLDALFAVIPHGAEYVSGTGVVLFLGLSKIVNSSFSIGTNILNFSHFYPFSLLFIAILTILAFALNNYLIPLWGLNGSACATLFAYVIYFLLLLCFVSWKLKVSIFSLQQLRVLFLVAVLLGLNTLWNIGMKPQMERLPFSPTGVILVDACLRTLLLLLVAMVLTYKLRISTQVNALMRRVFHKLFRR